MNTVILRTAVPYLTTLLILSSFFLVLRGHNEPGGGFAGGLVAAAAFGLHVLVNGLRSTQQMLRIDPRYLLSTGLLLAVFSGAVSLVLGKPFMTGVWWSPHFGTPLFFDLGVYLVVVGVTLTIIFSMEESE
jgi:multicomponent Na+:H+ antiporter subunit B